MENAENKPVSLGDWMLTHFITFIPFIGIVMLFVWAFGDNSNESKKNWARAYLLWILIGTVSFCFFITLASLAGTT